VSSWSVAGLMFASFSDLCYDHSDRRVKEEEM
jgi:hypothetical protein